ncbi:hypothetical protein MMC30_004856 [Trapelia coarctata]|nr:hypothetical protein [Trapelia coarctata]
MSPKLFFATVDVFTCVRFAGNPLAIVNVPSNVSLTQDQKQKIAREFNYSETVFLHEDTGTADGRRIDIFTTTDELPFAGMVSQFDLWDDRHPTIGTLCYIGCQLSESTGNSHDTLSLKLLTKAGTITATYNLSTKTASAEIPHNIHIHSSPIDAGRITASQPSLSNVIPPEMEFPIVSIVKGMTFVLVDLPTLSALESLQLSKMALEPTCRHMLDEGWAPSMISPYYYVILHDGRGGGKNEFTKIRARMIGQPFGEDPATGSAACDLAAYLALKTEVEDGEFVFEIEQGVEMGRKSEIGVRVKPDATGKGVDRVELEGKAILFMQGSIEV